MECASMTDSILFVSVSFKTNFSSCMDKTIQDVMSDFLAEFSIFYYNTCTHSNTRIDCLRWLFFYLKNNFSLFKFWHTFGQKLFWKCRRTDTLDILGSKVRMEKVKTFCYFLYIFSQDLKHSFSLKMHFEPCFVHICLSEK